MRFSIAKLENSVFVCLCTHLSLYLYHISLCNFFVKYKDVSIRDSIYEDKF